MRWKNLAPRLALAALSLAAALVLAELGLHLFHPVRYRMPPAGDFDEAWRGLLHRSSDVPGLHYELVPNHSVQARGSRIRTNGHGMRDEEPLPDDTPGLFRIAVLGDSFTFGYGVESHETYASILESLLDAQRPKAGCRYEVLNFGVSGYSTRDEAVVLRFKAMGFRPRQVVVGYVLNDPQKDPIQPLQTHFAPARWWQRFHLGRLVAQAKNLADRKRIAGGSFYDYLHAEGRDNWRSVVEAFDGMASVAGPEVSVLVAIFPEVPNEGWDAYRYRHLHEQVAHAARAAGHDVLDLLPVLARHEPGILRLSPTDEHPTALAHRVVAAAICARLQENGPLCTAAGPDASVPRRPDVEE